LNINSPSSFPAFPFRYPFKTKNGAVDIMLPSLSCLSAMIDRIKKLNKGGLTWHIITEMTLKKIKWSIQNFYFYDQNKQDYINGYIVLISDFTVCGKCLDEELEVMNTFKEKAKEKHLAFLGIIGVNNRKEEAEIIKLYKTEAIFFPCKTIDVNVLYQTFKLNKDYFLDTPFYFYMSHEFLTLEIFKPPLIDKKEMIRWLTIITDQDVF